MYDPDAYIATMKIVSKMNGEKLRGRGAYIALWVSFVAFHWGKLVAE